MGGRHAAQSTQCYRGSAAPSRTPAIIIATPPTPATLIPNGCAESAALLVVDGGGAELAGAVVEAAVLEADPDTEDAETEAEVDDGTKDGKKGDAGRVAAAVQNCSTSAFGKEPSAGGVSLGKRERGEEDAQRIHAETVHRDLGGAVRGRRGEAQAVRHRARQLAYKHEEKAHAPHEGMPLREGSAAKRFAAGISVYSPHTALGGVFGGMNDWLASCTCADPQKVPRLETKPATEAIFQVGYFRAPRHLCRLRMLHLQRDGDDRGRVGSPARWSITKRSQRWLRDCTRTHEHGARVRTSLRY
ncbi:hypothetical protein FB451DRAFT_1571973, partial [Mycena latifolia]